MKKLHFLTKNFIVYSFTACFITGILLILFINSHVKTDMISSYQEMIHLTLHFIVEPELQVTDFNSTLSPTKAMVLDSKLQHLISDGTVSTVRIWNTENLLIYSTNQQDSHALIDNETFKNLLKKDSHYVIAYDFLDNNQTATKVVRFYLPITQGRKTVAVYEVIKSYSNIQHHIREITLIISLIIFLCLILLYLLLLKIIYTSSKTLIDQNEALSRNKVEIESAYFKLNNSYKSTILALSNSIDARDTYTAGHSKRVSEISIKIGKHLGLSEEKLQTLEIAALLHDIGKLGIPDEILHKPGKLNDYEYSKIKEHPSIGADILRNIEFLKDVLPVILYHHERYDGGGYPCGISGNEIPLEARIISVADAFDAMVSDRPYRKGMPYEAAVSELVKNKYIQFDNTVVDAFLLTTESSH